MKAILSLLMIASVLTACGTSPDPDFYTLDTVPGMPAVSPIKDTIKIVRPDIPEFLDRPDFVSQTGSNQVIINETANWAEPLPNAFERVLASDLQQRLPAARIETDADDETFAPRFVIESKLDQFNAIAGGEVALRGHFILTDLHEPSGAQTIPFNLTVANLSHHPESIAKSLSDLIGQYADQIVANLMIGF